MVGLITVYFEALYVCHNFWSKKIKNMATERQVAR